MTKYYQIAVDEKNRSASVLIYGDITSLPWMENDVDSYSIVKELDELDVDEINVYINSYGGEVAESLAIYNALTRHKAKVITHDDGFACSGASVVFMAGDERVMSNASLLFIHPALCCAGGNAAELRKTAEDLDKITEGSIAAYMSRVNITREKLMELMDAETWLLPAEAVEMGFATSVIEVKDGAISQSAMNIVFDAIKAAQMHKEEPPIEEKQITEETKPEEKQPATLEMFLDGLKKLAK